MCTGRVGKNIRAETSLLKPDDGGGAGKNVRELKTPPLVEKNERSKEKPAKCRFPLPHVG